MNSKMNRTNYYDLHDRQVSGKTKTKAPVDPDAKKKALHAIALAHGELAKIVDRSKITSKDVNFWNAITSQLATGFIVFKQGLRNTGSFAAKLREKRANDSVSEQISSKKPRTVTGSTINPTQTTAPMETDEGPSPTSTPDTGSSAIGMPKNVLVKIDDISGIWKRVINCVYLREAQKDDQHIGTINSFLCLMNGFSRRLNEAMYPSGDIKFGMEEGIDKKYRPSAFGLDETHYHLLSGITISPHARSGLAMTLSPLTIAIILALTPVGKYQDKWKRAFKQAFGLFDDVDQLADFVATNGRQSTQIFRLLATAIEYGLVRANNKAYIPWVLINAVYPLTNYTTAETYNYLSVEGLSTIDFSGKGLWKLWNAACKAEFEWNFSPNSNVCQQMFIHGIFDSHREDLTIPQYMFGINFDRRNQLTDDLDKKKFRKTKFSLPIPKYISKMATAATSRNTGGGVGQQSRAPVFAGNCYQELGNQDFLLSRMDKGPRNVTASMNPVDKLEARLLNVAKTMESSHKLEFGNVSFVLNKPGDPEGPYGGENNQQPQPPLALQRKYYLQRD